MLIFKDIFNNKTSPASCQQEFDKILTKISPKKKEVFSVLLEIQKRFMISFPSQENIAKKLGISRKHVWETTEFLHEIGFLCKVNRGYKKSCIYRFNPELFKFNLRQILVKHFPFLKWIPLTFLIALQDRQIFNEVTLRRKSLFNNNIIITYSKRTTPKSLYNYLEKGKIMEQSKPTAYDEAKKLLKLTQVGMAKLLLFEEEALNYAIDQYKIKLRIKHKFYPTPFGFLFNTAQDYSKSNNLKLDWTKFYEWKEKLNWDKATANTEYENQRGYAKPYVNKFIDKNIKLNNNHSPIGNPGIAKNKAEQTQCPIMVTRSTSIPEIYYRYEDFPLDFLLTEINNTKREIESLKSISNSPSKIYADIVLPGLLSGLQKLENELSRRNSQMGEIIVF